MGSPGDKKLWMEVGMTLLWGLVSALVAHAFAATQSGGLCAHCVGCGDAGGAHHPEIRGKIVGGGGERGADADSEKVVPLWV